MGIAVSLDVMNFRTINNTQQQPKKGLPNLEALNF